MALYVWCPPNDHQQLDPFLGRHRSYVFVEDDHTNIGLKEGSFYRVVSLNRADM